VIIGAGIAGLATAVALRQRGVDDVLVLESAPALRTEGLGLSLWANAWRAIDALDGAGGGGSVAAAVRAASGPPLRTFEFASSSGRVLKSFTLREATRNADETDDATAPSDEFRGVRRADLLRALLGALPEGSVRFGVRGEVAEAGGGDRLPRVRLVRTGDEKEDGVLEARCVVGADSARSALATGPLLALPQPRYNGYVAWRGVARGAGDGAAGGGDWRGPRGGGGGGGGGAAAAAAASATDGVPPVRIALGAGVRAGVYPLGGGDTYWFVTRNAPAGAQGADKGDPAALKAEALDAVASWQWTGMRDLIEATPAEVLSRARIGDRWTFCGQGRRERGRGAADADGGLEGVGVGRGRVTLAGDALHPMSPNLGQGGCAALEGAVVLAAALGRAFELESERGAGAGASRGGGGDVVARALRLYERERVSRTLELAVRSAAVGFALQLPYAPVVALRDAVVERVFKPTGFLDHTRYDCRAAAREVAAAVGPR
jgi:2-polyprenyl-6-methoxyphenol hydroxylase-like FAD-dependent oxidoreductase